MAEGTVGGSQLKPQRRGARPMEYLPMRAAHSSWNQFKRVTYAVGSTVGWMKPVKPFDTRHGAKDLESTCCFSFAFCQHFLTSFFWNRVVQAASLDLRRM